ncbi:MAG: fibronectin type III domain-containing protein [Planctomycetes bacterium]|nr:fibronectin type III domain-containing protein [Planctomycetota bacterium]
MSAAWPRTFRGLAAAALILLSLGAPALAQIPGVTLNSATETVFFRSDATALRGVVLVNTSNGSGGSLSGTVSINAGGETVATPVTVPAGTSDLVAHMKRIWPAAPDTNGVVTLTVGGNSQALPPKTLGVHRPWTIHVVMDKHLDYMWDEANEQQTRDKMEALAHLFLSAIEQDKLTAFPHDEQTHFSFDQTIWWDVWEMERPKEAARLESAEGSGHLGVGSLYTVLLTGCLGTEEMVRALYPARALERAHGAHVRCAVPMETSSIAWGLATVLAQSGSPYAVKGICNCAGQVNGGPQLGPDSLFRWTGPDGSSVLLKWDHFSGDNQSFGGYAECYKLWAHGSDVDPLTPAQEQDILSAISRFEGYGAAYPVDQIMLYGLGWDFWNIGPARLTATIRAWNADMQASGYEYPRLKNSRAEQFFLDVEQLLAAHGAALPLHAGCFGADWEVWLLYHARACALARAAREQLVSAESLSAVAASLDPADAAAHRELIEEAYKRLLVFAEHTATSTSTMGSPYDAGPAGQLKKDCAQFAATAAELILDEAEHAIGARVRTGDQLEGETLLVLNATQYGHDAVVETEVAGTGPFTVQDAASGAELPAQVLDAAPPHVLRFLARDLPAVGYRTFRVQLSAGGGAPAVFVDPQAGILENEYYRVAVSPASGAVISLVDKTRGNRELVSKSLGAPGANAFCAKGSYPASASISARDVGPLSASLVVTASAAGRSSVTTITLHGGVDRVEFDNAVTRPPGSDTSDEVRFDFPWNFSAVQHRYEAGAAVTRPGYATQSPPGDHLPGSTMGYFAMQRWADLHGTDAKGAEGGVRVAAPDTYMLSLGASTVWYDPQVASPRVNFIGFDNSPPNGDLAWLGDQDDETQFRFRFVVQGYLGPFDGPANARHALTGLRRPRALPLPADQAGDLPGDFLSFLEVSPGSALLTAFKVAEEGPANGYVARLWDAGLSGASAMLAAGRFAVGQSCATDLLERDLAPLAPVDGVVSAAVPARGFTTLRLVPGSTNAAPIANAGLNHMVAPGQTVTLDGRASTDSDDAPEFRWFQISGKRVRLSGGGTPLASFVAPQVGSAAEGLLAFQLVVDDHKHRPSTATTTVTVTFDRTPPGAPPWVKATARGQEVALSWGAAFDPESGVTGYRVHRAAGNEPIGLWKTVGGNVTTLVDPHLHPHMAYSYRVTAVNGAGMEGPARGALSVLTGDAPPDAPAGLTALAADNAVHLTWNPPLDPDVAGYSVYRGPLSGGPYQPIAEAGPAPGFIDDRAHPGVAYYYVVRSHDAALESADSNEAAATPRDAPPPAPASLIAAPGSYQVHLAWTPVNALDVAGYRVYRSLGGPGPHAFAFIAETPRVEFFSDYTVQNGVPYVYEVRARDARQEGPPSPAAEATPAALVRLALGLAADSSDATSVQDVVRVSGFSASDPNDYVSNDADANSAGFIFSLPVPRFATITSAVVRVTAGPFQNPDANGALEIRVFDAGDCPPFVDGQAIDLLDHQPVRSQVVSWPAGLAWSAGSVHATPPLDQLAQVIVARPDWQPGNRVGFVVTEGSIAPGSAYGWNDASAGAAPVLELNYALAGAPALDLSIAPLLLGRSSSVTLGGGDPFDVFGLLAAAAPFYLPLPPYGNLLVPPHQSIAVANGLLDAAGAASFSLFVPKAPALLGVTVYFQAFGYHLTPAPDLGFSGLVVLPIE